MSNLFNTNEGLRWDELETFKNAYKDSKYFTIMCYIKNNQYSFESTNIPIQYLGNALYDIATMENNRVFTIWNGTKSTLEFIPVDNIECVKINFR